MKVIISFSSKPIRTVRSCRFSMKEWTSLKHKPNLGPILHVCALPAIRIIAILLMGRNKDETAIHCWPGCTCETSCIPCVQYWPHVRATRRFSVFKAKYFFFIEDGQLIMDCSVIETETACFKACLKIHCTLMLFFLETVIIAQNYAYKPKTNKDGS